MPVGLPPTAEDTQTREALDQLASPEKQLELVDKRSTWVFSTVGVVATAVAGFSAVGISTGALATFWWSAIAGVVVVLLALAAIATGGSSLVIRRRTVRTHDPAHRKAEFDDLLKKRIALAQAAVACLVGAIVLAGLTALAVWIVDAADGPEASAALELVEGEDGATLEISVEVEGLGEGDSASAVVTTEAADGTETTRYESEATAGSDGKVELEGTATPGPGETARLTVTSGGDRLESVTVDLGGDGEAASPDDAEAVVEASMEALEAFWSAELEGEVDGGVVAPEVRWYDTSNGGDGPTCGPREETIANPVENSFFCTDGFIAVDRALARALYPDHGTYGLAVVLGHEWGHLVLYTLDPGAAQSEVQADCLAGAWAAAEEGSGSALGLAESGRAGAYAALAIQQAEPQVTPRIDAFDDGLDHGVTTCRGYSEPSPSS